MIYRNSGEAATKILGLEAPPVLIWGCGFPTEWIDWQIIEHLVDGEDGGSVAELGEFIGLRGALISGRCRSLHRRGLLAEVRGERLRLRLSIDIYGERLRPDVKVYRVSYKALRKAGRR